jgi:hypothetical protein
MLEIRIHIVFSGSANQTTLQLVHPGYRNNQTKNVRAHSRAHAIFHSQFTTLITAVFILFQLHHAVVTVVHAAAGGVHQTGSAAKDKCVDNKISIILIIE